MTTNKRKRTSSESDSSSDENGNRPAPALPRLPPPYIFNPGMSISEYRQFAWLERSKNWDGLDPTEWQARKILGAGTYGLVGLWEYIGLKPKMPTHMVVKQTVPEKKHELASESKFLGLTTSTGTDHVVKLYKGYHEVEGTGVTDKGGWDGLPFGNDGKWDEEFEIARMYIEYCGGGDLWEWMKNIRKVDRRFVIPEEVLWRMLLCLAKAVLVLNTGTEDPSRNASNKNWKRRICHFDIKPQNMVLGTTDATEHRRFGALKLADFGLACFEPETAAERQADEWVESTQWRATPTFHSPEQYYTQMQGREIGAETNTWTVGASIYRLICREVPDITTTYQHNFQQERQIHEVVGNPNVLLNPVQCPYSQRFIDTLAQCLTYKPKVRIRVSQLVITCQQHVDKYDEDNKAGAVNSSTSSGPSGSGPAPSKLPINPPEPPTDSPKPPPDGPNPSPPPNNNDNALSGPNIPPPRWKLQVAPNPMPKIYKPYDPDKGDFEIYNLLENSPDAGIYDLLFVPAKKPTKTKMKDFPFQKLEETPPAQRKKDAKARAARKEAAQDEVDNSPTIISPSGTRRNPPEFKDLPVPSPARRRKANAPPKGRSPSPDPDEEV